MSREEGNLEVEVYMPWSGRRICARGRTLDGRLTEVVGEQGHDKSKQASNQDVLRMKRR